MSAEQRKQLQLQVEAKYRHESEALDRSEDDLSEHKMKMPPTSIDRSSAGFTSKVRAGDIKCDLKSCISVA